MGKIVSAAYLVRRMMHTKRWTIINTSRQQTISEHTCGVMLLLDRMAADFELPESDHLALLRYALYHDAFEVVSGDMPGSFKRNRPDIKAAINAAENAVDWLPATPLPAHLKDAMRAADLAESVIYLDDAGVGRRAQRVVSALRNLIAPVFQYILGEPNKLEDDEDLGNY
jgi:5'-deoxynucleotidase YfbR-like HD superfamily hydrolase